MPCRRSSATIWSSESTAPAGSRSTRRLICWRMASALCASSPEATAAMAVVKKNLSGKVPCGVRTYLSAVARLTVLSCRPVFSAMSRSTSGRSSLRPLLKEAALPREDRPRDLEHGAGPLVERLGEPARRLEALVQVVAVLPLHPARRDLGVVAAVDQDARQGAGVELDPPGPARPGVDEHVGITASASSAPKPRAGRGSSRRSSWTMSCRSSASTPQRRISSGMSARARVPRLASRARIAGSRRSRRAAGGPGIRPGRARRSRADRSLATRAAPKPPAGPRCRAPRPAPRRPPAGSRPGPASRSAWPRGRAAPAPDRPELVDQVLSQPARLGEPGLERRQVALALLARGPPQAQAAVRGASRRAAATSPRPARSGPGPRAASAPVIGPTAGPALPSTRSRNGFSVISRSTAARQLDVRHLQQADGLLQLRREHQTLGLPQVEPHPRDHAHVRTPRGWVRDGP